jgi:eukaryotic-like serine/threonine-protein kinase
LEIQSSKRILKFIDNIAPALKIMEVLGITHLDLKPGNIFLSDDETRDEMLDLGLSQKVMLHGVTDDKDHQTVRGTTPYLSPEQALVKSPGDPDLDFTSDLYSLGLVVYEMMTGEYLKGNQLDEQDFMKATMEKSRDLSWIQHDDKLREYCK